MIYRHGITLKIKLKPFFLRYGLALTDEREKNKPGINIRLPARVYICGAKEEGNKSNFYENRDKAIFHLFEVQYTIF